MHALHLQIAFRSMVASILCFLADDYTTRRTPHAHRLKHGAPDYATNPGSHMAPRWGKIFGQMTCVTS